MEYYVAQIYKALYFCFGISSDIIPQFSKRPFHISSRWETHHHHQRDGTIYHSLTPRNPLSQHYRHRTIPSLRPTTTHLPRQLLKMHTTRPPIEFLLSQHLEMHPTGSQHDRAMLSCWQRLRSDRQHNLRHFATRRGRKPKQHIKNHRSNWHTGQMRDKVLSIRI